MFLSHSWSKDCLGRDTHERTKQVARHLKQHDITVWLDEDKLRAGNLDAQIAQGISKCKVFIVCLTRDYHDKVNRAANDAHVRDNCFKEWSYAHQLHKPILPLIMEPCMQHVEKWEGVIAMHLSGLMYLNVSFDDLKPDMPLFKQFISTYIDDVPSKKIETKYRF